jgi:hypothetical protein
MNAGQDRASASSNSAGDSRQWLCHGKHAVGEREWRYAAQHAVGHRAERRREDHALAQHAFRKHPLYDKSGIRQFGAEPQFVQDQLQDMRVRRRVPGVVADGIIAILTSLHIDDWRDRLNKGTGVRLRKYVND